MAARVTAFVVFAIVAVTFVAGLIVGAQRADDSGPVDLIVYNARIYTGDPNAAFAEAIAVRGNRILRVGSNRDIKRLMRRATTVIDAHGASVTAGFHEGRVDLQAAGHALMRAAREPAMATDAPAHATAPSVGPAAVGPAAVGAAAVGAPAAVSSVARAASPAAEPSTIASSAVASSAIASSGPASSEAAPTGAASNSAAPSHATAGKGVASVASSSRLAAGKSLASADDAPTAEPRPEDTLEAIRRAVAAANRVGITSVEVTARSADDLLPYDTLLRTKELKARVSAALLVDWPLDAAAVEQLDATRKRYEPVPFFKVEAVRLVVGDAGDDEAREAELSRTIALLEERDWQIVLQTANVAGAARALNAIEAARSPGAAASTEPKRRVRLELEAPVDDEMAARIARLSVVASVPQPLPAAGIDLEGAPAPASTSWPYLNLLAGATPVVFHSSWPLAPMDPRFALSAMLFDGLLLFTEKTSDEDTLSARIGRIFDAYTRHAAYAAADEEEKGTIAKEMLADIVIFSTDLFALPPDKILDAEVATTIFDGAVVYTKPDLAPVTDSQ